MACRLKGKGTAELYTFGEVSVKGEATLNTTKQTQLPLVLDNCLELHAVISSGTGVLRAQNHHEKNVLPVF